jgi:choline kinase
MRAIILAAGLGSRLGSKANGQPKALLRIGDRTIIEHQLEMLSSEGVGQVIVVVGHREDEVRKVLGESVEYVSNERPSDTNSLYSLWLAREWLTGDVVLLNSDLLFDPGILKNLLATDGNALAYDSLSLNGAEQTKVGLQGGRVIDLGKDLPITGARGENLGLIKLDEQGSAALRQRVEAIVAAGEEKAWVTEAVRSTLADVEVRGVNVAGQAWVEIDFPYDLDRARRVVWPAIWKHHPDRKFRRRASWVALAVSPMLLLALAWRVSARVGPASVDWETLAPESGALVRLQRGDDTSQRWWLLRRGDTLAVQAPGGGRTRLEARPVVNNASDTAAFALAILLDGKPFRYEARRAAIDTKVQLPGQLLGKRDRETYLLPAGSHRLAIHYLAGTTGAILVRVRQSE